VTLQADPTLPAGHADQITWTVTGVQQWGRYVTGDIWVVPSGASVTVTTITPAPTITTQAGITYHLNGTMLNPQGGYVQYLPSSIRSERRLGYDSRSVSGAFHTLEFKQVPITLSPDNVIVSTISIAIGAGGCSTERPYPVAIPGIATPNNELGCTSCPTRIAHVLSCVAAQPDADAFRRPYGMDPARRLGLRHLRASQIQFQLLPRLPRLTGVNDLSPAVMKHSFDRVWLDHYPGEWAEDNVHPSAHLPGYGQYTMHQVSLAAGVLLTDYYHPTPLTTVEQQETDDFKALLYGVLQFGIDSWGLLQNGSAWTWNGTGFTDVPTGDSHRFEGGGGKGGGQKFPMLLCKKLFAANAYSVASDPTATTDMSPPQRVLHENSGHSFTTLPAAERWVFKEDEQAFSGTLVPPSFTTQVDWAWQGSPWKWRKDDDAVSSSWYQHEVPTGNNLPNPASGQNDLWSYINAHSELYRFSVSETYVGIALAARQLNMMEDWANDAFFGYVDRWMIPQHAAANMLYGALLQAAPGDPTAPFTAHIGAPHRDGQRFGFPSRDFCKTMWDKYRWHGIQRGVQTWPDPGTLNLPLAFNAMLPASSLLQSVPPCAPYTSERVPMLVTQHRPVGGNPMLFELYVEPAFTGNFVSLMFTGAPLPQGARLPAPTWSTQPIVFIDPGIITGSSATVASPYGYTSWGYSIPSAFIGADLAAQAVLWSADNCWLVSNALAFQVQAP
jgi:hypothetical protein